MNTKISAWESDNIPDALFDSP